MSDANRSPERRSAKRRPITDAEIAAAASADGDFAAERLRAWGLSFPPKAGWRRKLLRIGVPVSCPYPLGFVPPVGDAAVALDPMLPSLSRERIDMPLDALRIFTDGSGQPGGGSGGWSFVAYRQETEIHASLGGETITTNNRMELRAVIEALRWLESDAPAILVTDSQYVLRGAVERRKGWRRQNWSRGGKPSLANADLWRDFEETFAGRAIDIRWTRAHAGTMGNERADALAQLGRRLFAR